MPSLAEKQQHLIARLHIIEDAHERLSAIVSRGRKWPAPATDERTDAHLVPGCVSRVWLAPHHEPDGCHFPMDADSPMVKGLVALLCELYEGASAREIAEHEPDLFPALGLDRQLSPTRLHGLANVQAMIRAFAQAHRES